MFRLGAWWRAVQVEGPRSRGGASPGGWWDTCTDRSRGQPETNSASHVDSMPKVPVRQRKRDTHKKGCKDPKRTERHYKKLIARYEGYLKEIEAGNRTPGQRKPAAATTTPETARETVEHNPNEPEKRLVVKFFYEQLGSPPEEDWSGPDGAILEIMRRMGSSAPSRQMVYRTLVRLAEGDDDIQRSRKGGNGQARVFKAVDRGRVAFPILVTKHKSGVLWPLLFRGRCHDGDLRQSQTDDYSV